MLLKVGGIAAAIIIVLGIGVVAGIYFGFVPNPFLKPPEHSARYYPQDTLAYAWVTLYPGGNQGGQMRDLWERFNESRAFRNRLDDLLDSVEEETGLDLEQDVFPWAGPDFSIGVIELRGSDTPMLAATVGVRDKDAAAIFVDQWLDYLEDTDSADFDADTYRDMEIWVDKSAGQAYALTQDLLIAVEAGDETEDVLEEMLDLASGAGRGSLSETPDFQAARDALPGRRFASVYVNSRATLDSIADYSADFSDLLASAGWDKAPDWVAGSAKWVERGVVLETVAPNSNGYGQSLGVLSNPAGLIPEDTLAFAAATFDPDMDNWRAELSQYTLSDWMGDYGVPSEALSLSAFALGTDLARIPEPDDTSADLLDFALEMVDDGIGINLETDLFDYLGGAAIVAVSEFDFDQVNRNPEENPVDAVAMLSYLPDNEGQLSDTMDKAADLLDENFGLDTDPTNVGADNLAQVFDLRDFDSDYSPGYVLHSGYVTLGTTEEALEAIVSAQQGELGNLAATGEYGRATGPLPANQQFLAWVNLQRIIAQLNASDMQLARDEYRLMRDSLGALAVSVNADGDYIRAYFVLTLFPE